MSSGVPRALAVLLVEDSPADGRLLIEVLKPAIASGAIVIQTVKTLALAMEALQGFDFSCVLLDLGLPDGRGIDSVRALREVERKAAIIVLTGLDDERLAGEALSQGAQDYLVKGSSDGEQLLRQLRRAVQRHQQTYSLEQRHDRAFFEASHDALTLLPNSALFTDRARQRLIAQRHLDSAPNLASMPKLSLAYLELTGLDEVRLRYGSLRADELLRSVAEHWSESLDPQDTLARIGSNSFALLRPTADCEALLQHFHRHVSAATTSAMIDKALLLIVGVVTIQDTLESIEQLMTAAQQAAAYQSSEPKIALPQSDVSTSALTATVEVQWQPWIDVSSQRCIGLELIALNPPAESLDSDTLAAYALTTAAALATQSRQWAQTGFMPTRLSLNIPVAALASEGFVTGLIQQIALADIAPERVQLEISEAAFMRLSQHAATLAQLRKQGFRLVLVADGNLDISFYDFSVSPVDGYKLGPNLVRQLTDEMLHGNSRRVVNAMLGAAQHLGATIIASGVDSEASIATLRVTGVRWMQGRALLPAQDAVNVPLVWDRPVALRV